jgi:uncharacterized protein YecE (DUF72 family)
VAEKRETKTAVAPAANLSPADLAERKAERRAKREAKRAKQRLENVGRAKAMHVQRLAESIAPESVEPAGSALQIGCSGWFYWHWGRCFYPPELTTKDWFDYYARRFSTVEVSELITHTKRFAGTKTLVRDFGFIADLLGPRMGCFLFQLPPSFHYTPARLKSIVAQLEPHRRNVVEFRHVSWWNDKVYAAFKQAGIIFCSCSGPRLPDALVKTADEIYVRFHGLTRWYRHNYSDAELEVWAERIQASRAKRVWVYFNNDNDCNAIANARTLRRLLRRLK